MTPWTRPASHEACTIETREGCTIIYGHMPLGAFLEVLKQADDTHMLHPEVARMLGATAVIGPAQGLEQIRRQERPAGAPKRDPAPLRSAAPLAPDALEWLAHGDQDASSIALFALLSHVKPPRFEGRFDLPGNAESFRRCRLMVEKVPSLASALGELAAHVGDGETTAWSAIAESWDDLCAQMDHESPEWRETTCEAAGVDAMLTCFHDVETDHAELHAPEPGAYSYELGDDLPFNERHHPAPPWLM